LAALEEQEALVELAAQAELGPEELQIGLLFSEEIQLTEQIAALS